MYQVFSINEFVFYLLESMVMQIDVIFPIASENIKPQKATTFIKLKETSKFCEQNHDHPIFSLLFLNSQDILTFRRTTSDVQDILHCFVTSLYNLRGISGLSTESLPIIIVFSVLVVRTKQFLCLLILNKY